MNKTELEARDPRPSRSSPFYCGDMNAKCHGLVVFFILSFKNAKMVQRMQIWSFREVIDHFIAVSENYWLVCQRYWH